MTTRLSTKGQLIVPHEMRQALGWVPGTRLSIELRGRSVVIEQAGEDIPETTLDEVAGCLRYEGPAKTLEEMEAGIARGAREWS